MSTQRPLAADQRGVPRRLTDPTPQDKPGRSPRQAVILAAGEGTRLHPVSGGRPKPLTLVSGISLIERAITTFQAASVSEVVVVVGHGRELLLPELASLRIRRGIRIVPAICPDWADGNGASALAAMRYAQPSFFLAMADHLFDPSALDRLVAADDGQRACALLVDRALNAVRDLDEATKVQTRGNSIIAIGKRLSAFDAVDTGVFLCRPRLFDALRDEARRKRHTLTDAVQRLAAADDAAAVDGTGLAWFDVDTEEDLRVAETSLGAVSSPSGSRQGSNLKVGFSIPPASN